VSRAFVKESDGSELEELPELVVSPHRNLVTPEGLQEIEATIDRLETEHASARSAGDRGSQARAERDLRYWRRRRATAEVVNQEPSPASVRFGCTVSLEAGLGRTVRYRIVGEDEADPKRGLISYVSPLATMLLGCAPGETVQLRDGEAEIVAIE
jgi:transcription elongation GreA/GreB family factor